MTDETTIPPPLCVWCSAPWTDDMLKVYAETTIEDGYYEGDYYLRETDLSIKVTCASCNRLVYKKEITVMGERKY